ncbi:hypothetical protein AAIA72_04015 [Hahella sp. SMD15-11]|uniref:Uncharacterized protein n=1 Tax=Thermohahella caldifontis TaxID=3142973 RepID=A0AB39UYW4_9GAMM
MHTPVRHILIFIQLLLLAGLVRAEPLTGDIITRWMDSQESVMAWSARHEAELSKYDSQEARNPLDMTAEQMLAPVHAAGLYDDLKGVLGKAGFSSPEQWSDISMRIARAAMALEFEKMEAERGGLDAQLQEVDRQAGLSAEQKQMIKQNLQQSYAMMASMAKAPEADKAALRPHMDALRAMMAAAQGGQ